MIDKTNALLAVRNEEETEQKGVKCLFVNKRERQREREIEKWRIFDCVLGKQRPADDGKVMQREVTATATALVRSGWEKPDKEEAGTATNHLVTSSTPAGRQTSFERK